MKIAKSRLKEIIKEEMEMYSDEDSMHHGGDPEYDQEGYMTKSALFKIAEYATELHDMIGDNDNLPEWMQFKVAKMSQMIGDLKHALEYDQEFGDYDEHQEETEQVYDEIEQELDIY